MKILLNNKTYNSENGDEITVFFTEKDRKTLKLSPDTYGYYVESGKVETKPDYNPKFQLKEWVYFMEQNRIKTGQITKIVSIYKSNFGRQIHNDRNGHSLNFSYEYQLNNESPYNESRANYSEDSIFRDKDELIKKLTEEISSR